MQRTTLRGLAGLSILALTALAAPARALLIAPNPVPMRVANADAVVVGKVVGYADKKVPANRFKGDTEEYQIALVEVKDAVLGKLGKEIKVGFIPPGAGPVGPIGGPVRPIRPPIRRPGGVTLNLGQEVCLFLSKAPGGRDFYTAPMYFDVINKEGNPNFANEVAEARKAAALLVNPKASLKSKDAQTRLNTAGMLIGRYRNQRVPDAKQVNIDAEESKLILQTLANADWNPAPGIGRPGINMMNPQNLFFRLGLTPADGWVQPMDFKMLPDEAKKWLTANADKYRIKRFVNE